MKFNRIIIVCVLLTILTMGAVSASDDNATSDNLAVNEDLNAESSADEIELASEDDSTGTFSELAELINGHDGGVLELEKNYQQDPYSSEGYSFRDMEIVIDGKGHNLTGAHYEFMIDSFFDFDECDVTLKNINFYNSSDVAFNFFFGQVSIINCTFHDCRGVALKYEGGTSDSGFNVADSSFYDCRDTVIFSDVNYVDWSLTSYISGCKFINCSSSSRGIMSNYRGASWSLENCYFENCTVDGSIIGSGRLKKLDNCSFINCSPIKYLYISVYADDIVEGDAANIVFSFGADLNGTATITVDGENDYLANFTNGYGELNVTGLTFGEHSASVTLNDMDHFGSGCDEWEFNVLYDPNLEITTDGCADGKITFNFKLDEDITDDLYFRVVQSFWDSSPDYGWGEFFHEFYSSEVHVVNGVGSITVSDLEPDEYNATIEYYGDDYYMQSEKRLPFTFISSNGSSSAQTDSKIPAAPASPAAPVTQAPAVETVKLTLKAVAVKKSAKKLILRATLKVNGKAVKGKKVIFKFNGKTYKAKTNAKGIAKVTVKKSVLKKLKVGKKVKYQASYGKKVVKKTAKVKK